MRKSTPCLFTLDLFSGKTCTACRKWVTLTEFYVRRAAGDGLQAYCKMCVNSKRKPNRKIPRVKCEKPRQYKPVPEKPEKIPASLEVVYRQTKQNNRRCAVLGIEGILSLNEWLEICKEHEYRCARCKNIKKLAIDHVIALHKGGNNWPSNIQPLCNRCNCRKGVKDLDYR